MILGFYTNTGDAVAGAGGRCKLVFHQTKTISNLNRFIHLYKYDMRFYTNTGDTVAGGLFRRRGAAGMQRLPQFAEFANF